MEKLVLIGDSWGCGEWKHVGNNSIELNHPGIPDYLPYKTVNISVSGASNWSILYSMYNYMNQLQHLDQTYSVIVFQTDLMRTSFADKFDVDINEQIQEASSIEQLYTNLADIFYIKISNFSKQFNVPVYIVGALSDVDDYLFSLYNNKKNIICNSWLSLLYKDHVPSVIPLSLESKTLTMFKKAGRTDLCEQLLDINDKNFIEFNKILGLETMGPAFGDFHPSRLGHQILAEHIIKFVNKKEAEHIIKFVNKKENI